MLEKYTRVVVTDKNLSFGNLIGGVMESFEITTVIHQKKEQWYRVVFGFGGTMAFFIHALHEDQIAPYEG